MFFKKSKIKKGDVFAVQAGDFVGQMFCFIKQEDDDYVFITTPELKIQKVPIEKFDFAEKHNIIEHLENLPRNIFKVIKKQYEFLSEKNDRNSD
jgi:ribosomal protein L14E/L6E/L27E